MQRTPDIVISDIAMSEEDGYALIRKLRALPMQGSLLPELQYSANRNQQSPISGQPATELPLAPAPLSWGVERAIVPAIALTGYATTRDRDLLRKQATNFTSPSPSNLKTWSPRS